MGFGTREFPILADSVAKLFWAPERATLIQEQRLRRNIDSTNPSPRFDYCASAASCRVLQQNRQLSGRGAETPGGPGLTQTGHHRGTFAGMHNSDSIQLCGRVRSAV